MAEEEAGFDIEQKLPGEIQRDDIQICTYEPEQGIIRYHLRSTDQLEEDLAQMFGGGSPTETRLSSERHQELFNEACVTVLEKYGRYFPIEAVQKCFPGIDLKKLDLYNFKNAKIRFFVLSPQDFGLYQQSMVSPDLLEEEKMTGAYIKGADVAVGETRAEPSQTKISERVKYVSEQYVIIAKEPSEDEAVNTKLMEDWLRKRFRHEVLHALEVGGLLPHGLKEGATELYAQLTRAKTDDDHIPVSYKVETDIVYYLYNLAKKAGIEKTIIHGALLANDPEKMALLRHCWDRRLGPQLAHRVLNADITDDSAKIFASDLIHQALKSEEPIT